MQIIIDGIRKIVVLVLLMELVLQLQSGKQYEPYIKMLVGIMVVYSLVAGIFGVFSNFENVFTPMQEMQWTGDWLWEFEKQAEEITEENLDNYNVEGTENTSGKMEIRTNISAVPEIVIEEIEIGEIHTSGSTR